MAIEGAEAVEGDGAIKIADGHPIEERELSVDAPHREHGPFFSDDTFDELAGGNISMIQIPLFWIPIHQSQIFISEKIWNQKIAHGANPCLASDKHCYSVE